MSEISPYYSHACKDVANMLELEKESSKDSRVTVGIAGHMATAADGIRLELYGVPHVEQLSGRDDVTRHISTSLDTNYSTGIVINHSGPVTTMTYVYI
jgi:hypothetical protein